MLKNCLNCQKKFNASSRQKFCSVKCKDQYHYKLRKGSRHHVNQINNILFSNHGILHDLLSNKSSLIVFQSNLLSLGFNLKYHTHTEIVGKNEYWFCYEYGFRFIDKERVHLIKSSDLSK